MSFDFSKAIAEATKELQHQQLEAIVLGPSGAGKSTLMGTMPGKVLYLYTTGENHGPKSAKSQGGDNIVPVCIDYAEGQRLSPDDSFARLCAILDSGETMVKNGVKSVAIDGASELEALIRNMQKWEQMCLTSNGKHNGFAEPAATLHFFRVVLSKLKSLQRGHGIHFAVSCILDVKDLGPNGEIIDASPRLQGFSVAESLVQQFGDVIVVGRMQKNKEVKHKIQFMTALSKVSKDEVGNVKRAINFSPRVAGITLDKLPPVMDADLSDVIKLK